MLSVPLPIIMPSKVAVFLTSSPNNVLCSNAYFLNRLLKKNNMQIVAPKDGLKNFFLICIARFNFHPLNMTNC